MGGTLSTCGLQPSMRIDRWSARDVIMTRFRLEQALAAWIWRHGSAESHNNYNGFTLFTRGPGIYGAGTPGLRLLEDPYGTKYM